MIEMFSAINDHEHATATVDADPSFCRAVCSTCGEVIYESAQPETEH